MKKIVTVVLAILIITIIGTEVVWPHIQKIQSEKEAQIETERIKGIVAKGDSVVMLSFIKGDSALLNLAKEAAHGYVSQNILPRFFTSNIRFDEGVDSTDQKMVLAFQVMEKDEGVKALAKSLYEDQTFDRYKRNGGGGGGDWWNMHVSVLLSFLSDDVRQEIRSLALNASDDPYWMYRYVSKEKFREMLEDGQFDQEKTMGFILSTSEMTLATQIAEKLEDSTILSLNLGRLISKERLAKILRDLPLNQAHDFLLSSGMPKEDIHKLVSSRISETNGYDLLRYFAYDYLTEVEVNARIKHMSTSKLVEDFPLRGNFYVWSFSFDVFARHVVHSVRNTNDYILAVEFFQNITGSEKSEKLWLETLRKESTI